MKTLFNDGWSFAKLPIENQQSADGNAVLFTPDEFLGKEPSSFESVKIPHDWLIENTNNLYEDSVGFYKKSFELSSIDEKHFYLHFGAVYMNWALWINGKKAGEWKYGYNTVEFEITPFVNEGRNEVELIAVYQSPNSRWYSGAGIIRDVTLVTTGGTRIVNDGIYFVSRPQEENCFGSSWITLIQTEVEGNLSEAVVCHTLVSPQGEKVRFIDPKQTSEITKTSAPAMGTFFNADKIVSVDSFSALVDHPFLWSDETPNVYTLKTEVLLNGAVVDCVETQVGFRDVRFDPNRGLFVNGRHLKLNGVCQHHDFGALGAAFNIVALERQFLKLKEMGVNAIRTSHNPQDVEFLNLADRMGFFISDEFFDMWEKPKTTYDYGNYFVEWHERDASAQVRRDRNHPSLLMWSIGNEIYDTHTGNGFQITKDLRSICRRYDPEKNGAVTIASNYMQWEGACNCANETDVVGYNYAERLYGEHHEKYPSWCIYGSETSSTVQSRGIYHFPLENRLLTAIDNQCSCLGNCTTNWGAKNTSFVISADRDTHFSLGQFIWTGWDYIGEPTPYSTKNSFFGQIDTAGFEKDTFYLYKAAWNKSAEPFVHLLPYWDFNEGQLIDVRAYSNVSSVELFLNGKSLGKKNIDLEHGTDLSASWLKVPYEKGEIVAVAYADDGSELCRDSQKSFGDSASLKMSLEKIAKKGYYFIDISSVDSKNVPVANSRSRVEITVNGDAEIIGADNGDSTDYECYQNKDKKIISRRLFGNRLLVIVKAPNEKSDFTVTAASYGLECASLVFKSGEVDLEASNAMSGIELEVENNEVPVRKIELSCAGSRTLTPDNSSVSVRATVFPPEAKFQNLSWMPMMLEGVKSDSAEITVDKVGNVEIGKVKALSDGNFRLTCTASNGSRYSEIISEMEFEVSGLGRTVRNPYHLIEACKCSSSSNPVKLSFTGGACTENGLTWFGFDRIDFGNDGSDTFSVPIFSFDNELDFELWDGKNGSGTKLMNCHYSAPSIYNTYQANTYKLPRRLFGVHELTFVFKTALSFQGVEFERSEKAYAKLSALDCSSITGDSFTKDLEAVTGIGNNVVLEFNAMDFGENAADEITICGCSHVDNTIHLKFFGDAGEIIRIVEFPKTDGYVEKTFSLKGLPGKNTVSFVFLPGSNFDFKWFQFR